MSVIMPVYNGIEFLEASVTSVLDQNIKDFEFIIVDDGSTQPIADVIERFDDPRIRLHRNTSNIGLTRSLNICLDRARGDYLARQDGDDISLPIRFERQLECFDSAVGFVGCWARSIDADGNPIRGWVDRSGRGVTESLLTKYKRQNCMVDPSSIYSRAAVKEVGYYDEQMYRAQTYNYNRRIQAFFRGVIVDEVLYHRRVHRGSVGRAVALMSEYRGVDWNRRANRRAAKFQVIR